ncbi:unnamed protein product [Arabis nemorensis]|uniref:F-box domain-containing protein n=1 Tax=Arabis nemorensis TaxID=586526 RepID=A0A565BYW7_9BRAS|nr:unnamed protein product [Arabis nemorensis]
MNDLPLDLLDEILFKIDPVSVASIGCTNRFFRSYISDPKFDSYRFPGVESSLFYISSFRDKYRNFVYCQSFVSSSVCMSPGNETDQVKKRCYILGCCSGLLLLYIDDLFVVNPFTKRFRLLDHSESKFLPEIVGPYHPDGRLNVRAARAMCVGFAVARYQAKKRFKIVCIQEMQTMYRFEISDDGDSWRLSKTTIMTTGSKSHLTIRMKPVYLDDTLHWLRNDGSIIAFNPETEEAKLIPSRFHRKPDMKFFFAVDEKINRLTLISGTKEAISVYTLDRNLKWDLARRIKNVSMDEKELVCWQVVLYDGKRLVVREKKIEFIEGVVHVYDMGANSWGVLVITNWWAESDLDYYKYTPSLYFVEDDQHNKEIVATNDLRISYLIKIMRLIDYNQVNDILLTYRLGRR